MAETSGSEGSARFERAVASIDAANADDPVTVLVDGVEQPKELVHADLVEGWVLALDPGAGELQLLAARAHHLRRWVSPRTDYPEGRAGYLRWRADHKKRQAAEVAEILEAHGYDAGEIERVAAIVAKRGLGSDPQVQTHEDALCLAFLQLQFDELADQLGDDRMVEVVRKTIAKMSPRGLDAAGTVEMTDRGAALLQAALVAPAADSGP
ncbi:DUF4202 domain-containing protein [Aquihabitans sp. McL0605]|uniref:DUF4202 domain-containing protein n=1 Tax=Aquihabitans sp. McL0605 TaxID=3415671 RepID=UPI003CF04B57